MLLLYIAAQAALNSAPQSFSILVPVANQPCPTREPLSGKDIVVCADRLPDQTLPLPDEAVSPLPRPVNRDMTGAGALAAASTPCAVRMGGCTSQLNVLGMGSAAVRLVQKLVSPNSCCEEPGEATNAGKLVTDAGAGIARLFRHKPDKSGRVPIALDPPSTAGRVLP